MSKKTLALIAGLTVLTLILVVLALTTGQKAPEAPTATTPESPTISIYQPPTAPANSTLQLSPNPVSLVNNTASVDVTIDTATNRAVGVQFDVVYDPEVLNFTAIKPGSFFQNGIILKNEVDEETGRVTYIIAQTPSQMANPKTGTGTVATLTFTKRSTAPATGSTPLIIERAEVSAKNDAGKAVGNTVLKSVSGTSVNLTNSASQSGR